MTETTKPPTKYHRLYDIGLIILLLIGTYYRLVGLDWDADQNLHPDERFLTGVETALIPVKSFSDYWKTEISTLNPHNQGYGFFVYGTLPIFAVRYAAEWLGQTGWNDINLVGRQLSALADLLVIVVVYLAGTHLYGKRVGLLAAAFSTFTVLQIQLSHFFAVDTFLTLFTFLSVYLAIKVATEEEKPGDEESAFPRFRIRSEPLMERGVYRLTRDRTLPGVGAADELFAVNPDPREGDLTRFGLADLRADVFKDIPFDTPALDDVGTDSSEGPKGGELWKWLILAAVVCLVAEMIVAQRIGARQR